MIDYIPNLRVGDVFLNRRSGHSWRVLRIGHEIAGLFGLLRMVTLQNEKSGTIKYETSLYLLNPDVHTRISSRRA